MKILTVRVATARKLAAGHLWIHANELLGPCPAEPGAEVEVRDERGSVLGSATVNPASRIVARVHAHSPGVALDGDFVLARLQQARALREQIGAFPSGRQVHGEADGLPGLILDRHADVLVGQITTLAMERRKPLLVEAIAAVHPGCPLLWRNQSSARVHEGLPLYDEVALGEVPETVEIVENDTRFALSPRRGQKTGWFHDQRDNRALLKSWLGRCGSVLDLYAYLGGWGLVAARHGAGSVLCLDSSPLAVAGIRDNAARNGLSDRVEGVEAEAFPALKAMVQQGRRFDAVVVDPPAFVKRRKDLAAGTLAYRRLNDWALALVAEGGLLVSCSCSFHFSYEDLLDAVGRAASAQKRRLQLVATLSQGADHPVVPAIPETAYLKGVAVRVLARW